MENREKRFAVLIDSDNVPAKYVASIFNELQNYGFATYRHIYGDWEKGNSWKKEILLEYSIKPIQQYGYTSGKNSTDMAMVIDAMEILHQERVDGFCLVTSDSDFTPLAMHLREANMYVIGMGESKTPAALLNACNKFIHLNLIDGEEKEKNNVITPETVIEEAIIDLVIDNDNNGKSTSLGEVGSKLNTRFADFDVRNYGYSKLTVFVEKECPKLTLVQHNRSFTVELKQINKENIIKDILAILKKNGGKVKNMSLINDELKKTYGKNYIHNYGYNRISSFLKSFDEIEVNENTVSIKKAETTKKKK